MFILPDLVHTGPWLSYEGNNGSSTERHSVGSRLEDVDYYEDICFLRSEPLMSKYRTWNQLAAVTDSASTQPRRRRYELT